MTVSPFVAPPTPEAPIKLAQLEFAAQGFEPESGLTTLQAIRALGCVLGRFDPGPHLVGDFRTHTLFAHLLLEPDLPQALRSVRAMSSYVRALAERRLALHTPTDGASWR